MSKVNILGTQYKIEYRCENEDVKLKKSDGYIDTTTKKIVICKFERDDMTVEDLESYSNKVLRHEIIHGFLYESGLWNSSHESKAWGLDEEITDWFAIQSPKIFKAFEELKLI